MLEERRRILEEDDVDLTVEDWGERGEITRIALAHPSGARSLDTKIGAWRDPKKAAEDLAELKRYLKAIGAMR